jgi:RhtB (resistance to homoserine/threonine) family protein
MQNIAAFTAAAALLTITPGLDTALVLRTATSEGARRAALAGAGIVAGLLVWGILVALGLAVVLAASEVAFTLLKWAGAAYLVYLGIRLIVSARKTYTGAASTADLRSGTRPHRAWFIRGLLTNLTNPKIGVFYVSFLPQFIPTGANVGAFSLLFAMIHAMLGLIWFSVLILATAPIVSALRRPDVVRWLDRLVGCTFVGFGVRLALSSRR